MCSNSNLNLSGKNLAMTTSSGIYVDRPPAASGTGGAHTLGNFNAIGAVTLTFSSANGYGLALGSTTATDNFTINNNATGMLTLASLTETNTAARTITLGGTGSDNHHPGFLDAGHRRHVLHEVRRQTP